MSIIADNQSSPSNDFNGYKQPGSRDSVNDVGIRTLEESYINVSGAMTLPAARSTHPTYTDLILESASIISQKANYELLQVRYDGPSDDGGAVSVGAQGDPLFEPVTTLSRVAKQEPLDTHPNFKDSATSIVGVACDNDGTEANEDPEIIIRDSDGAFKRISDKANDDSLKGASSYLAPGQEYTIRYAAMDEPPLTNVGRVVDNLPLNGPDVSGDFNWLLISIDFTQKGEIYEVTERYLLSGVNGYADSIYNYTL
jgi:hypothetical protein